MSAADASLVEDLEQLGTARVACWLMTPRNWFDLPLAASRCAADGTTLQFTVRRSDGDVPVAALRLGDLQALYEMVRSWWGQLSGPQRPSSVADGAFDALLIGIRQTLESQADLVLRQGDTAGAPSMLQLPPIDHPLMADDVGALQVLRPLLQADRSPSLQAAVKDLSADPRLESAGRQRAWLRVLLQWAFFDDPASGVRKTLQAIYADGGAELLRAEAEALRGNYLAATAEQWRHDLGIDAASHRTPAFEQPRPPSAAAPLGEPDITVLIPSYQHESWIEATVASALAQTHREIAVLVVDDKSSDTTVAKARSIEDARLRVRVNRTNLGLGNSVLAALDRVETPFVALLNSDDVFHPQRLDQCLRVLAADATCQLVTTGLALIDRDGNRLTTSNVSRLADGDSVHSWVHWFARTQPSSVSRAQLFSELLRRNFLVTSSNIVCRTDWLRSKAASLQSLKYCVDWQLFLDAASDGVLVHIPDELLGYRLHDSNTVWFNPGRRWAYTLEVSRVAARAVQGYVESLPQEAEARITAVLQLVSDHLLANTEVDGLDLYLNQLLEGPLLERLEGASKTVRALLEKIEHQRRRSVEPDPGQQVRNEARSALMVALRDTVQQFQGQQKSWVDTEAWLRARIVEEEGKLRHAERQHQELRAGLEAEMRFRAERIAGLVDEAAGLEKARVALRKQLADAVVKRDAFERDSARAKELLAAATLRIEQLEAGNKALEGELTTAVQRGRKLGDELDARTEALAMARAVHRLAQATDKTELQLGRWLWRHGGRRVAKWRQKLQSLLVAMEHRLHRLLHRRRPIVLLTADPAAVAAEPAQLAQCLTDVGAAGAEPIVFSFRREVAALAAPNRSRTLLSLPERHAADLRFWGQRHGQRLESMLASITAATGTARDAVLSLAEMQRALGLARSAIALRSPLAAAPSFGAALAARVAAWLRNTPWCLWLDHLPLAPQGLDSWIVSELPTAALLTVTSPALADALVARGVPRERLVIAYAPATTTTHASNDRGRLLSGRVADGSDVSLLVTAVQELVRRGCECSLELVSPPAPDLDAMAAEERVRLQLDRAGLGDRITLQTGGPADVGRPMAWVAAVSPASAEEMRVPPGLLDAVASGLPIVASDVACLRGLLADGVDAILVAPGDAAAMADALQRVLESADLRSALGSSAMARHAATLRAGGSGHVVGARLKTLLTSIP